MTIHKNASTADAAAATQRLSEVARIWEGHARSDPLWAILSQNDKAGRQWNPEEFFATGRTQVEELFSELASFGVAPRGGRALDFGCGVGRLTHALAARFDTVVGVDISETMITLANKLNPSPGRIRFLLNRSDDLAQFESAHFDFVCTLITLQHVPPELSRRYLTEFLRVLKPRGILAFQLPSHLRNGAKVGYQVEQVPDEACRAAISVIEFPGAVSESTTFSVRLVVRNVSPVEWRPLEAPGVVPDTYWTAGDGTRKCSKVGQIDVGNHWLWEDGTAAILDDGRVSLPDRLGPGEEVVVDLRVTSPPRAGQYSCEFDVVQERLCWFGSKGSATTRVAIDVREPGIVKRIARGLASVLGSRSAGDRLAGRHTQDESARAIVSAAQWNRAMEGVPPVPGQPEPYEMHPIARADVERFVQDQGGELVGAVESFAAGWEWVSYLYCVRTRRLTK